MATTLGPVLRPARERHAREGGYLCVRDEGEEVGEQEGSCFRYLEGGHYGAH